MLRAKTRAFVLVLCLLYAGRVRADWSELPLPSGINFIGIGYNIIDGNPEGGDLATGGVDPGLLIGRRVFEWTYEDQRMSNDQQYRIPDEVEFSHRSSTVTESSFTTFYGTESYVNKLSAAVEISGGYSSVFTEVQFAASSRYADVRESTESSRSVFYATETIQNYGAARYRNTLARHHDYLLNDEFVAAACSLPNTYSESTYMNFIDEWGTHVVFEVALGSRSGQNYEETTSSFVSYASTAVASSVSASGSYAGYSASLSVDMASFTSSLSSGMSFGRMSSSYSVGSIDLNEPISLKLQVMSEVFEEDYWMAMATYQSEGFCDSSWDRAAVQGHVLAALQGYAVWRQIQPYDDPVVKIPLTWPDGTYGLPKPDWGCPNDHFTWNEGRRYHDTEDDNSNNNWSSGYHLAGSWGDNNMQHEFCMKTVSEVDEYHWIWPAGSYCIYKKGNCPDGFDEGHIRWDDEDDNNRNSHSGEVPDGSYGGNTVIYFCCRSDGVTDNPIMLPTDNSFVLFPRYEHCQEVNGMTVSNEWFRWDNEDDNNGDYQSAIHPYRGLQGSENVVLHFCFYQKEIDLSYQMEIDWSGVDFGIGIW